MSLSCPSSAFLETGQLSTESVLNAIGRVLEAVSVSAHAHADLVIEFVRPTARSVVFDSESNRYVMDADSSHVTRVSILKQPMFFVKLVRCLQFIERIVQNGELVMKRGFFYSHKDLFEGQRHSDEMLDAICNMLGVSLIDIHIVPSSKGMIAGNFCWSVHGNVFNCLQTTYLPAITDELLPLIVGFTHVVIIEKETIFFQLVDSKFHETFPVLLVTAKGYPDLNTRKFLCSIAKIGVVQVALVDLDPFGIDIYLCYKYGSIRSANELDCTLPELQHVGICFDDVVGQGVMSLLIPLTVTDISKIFALQKKNCMQHEKYMKKELDLMLLYSKKAEIEIIGDIATLLQNKLFYSEA